MSLFETPEWHQAPQTPRKANIGFSQSQNLTSPLTPCPMKSNTSTVNVKKEPEDSAIGSWLLQCDENPDYVLSNLSLVPQHIVNLLARKQLETMCLKKTRESKVRSSRLESYLQDETPQPTGNSFGSPLSQVDLCS